MRLRKNTIALAAAACTLLITNAAQAVVTFTFETAPGDKVIARVTGSFTAPDAARIASSSTGFLNGGVTRLVTHPGLDYSFWSGGTVTTTGLDRAPTTTTFTESFGYSGGSLYLPAFIDNSGTYAIPAGTTMTWDSSAGGLASIGLGSLTSTPLTVYASAGGSDTIRFAAIPEPSCVLLGVVTVLTVFSRRRRELR